MNEGSHQLRLYNQGPNGVDPFTESCLRDAHSRHVPCASLLVRLFKAPKGPNGKLLEVKKYCYYNIILVLKTLVPVVAVDD